MRASTPRNRGTTGFVGRDLVDMAKVGDLFRAGHVPKDYGDPVSARATFSPNGKLRKVDGRWAEGMRACLWLRADGNSTLKIYWKLGA